MASLSRPPTRQSTLSWWSDRNPPGATISIHFAAKPVMKLMYHQQAMSFLRKNRGAPLSSTTMDVYSSYLTYKYVAAGTRVVILGALREAIAKSSGDAQTVADALLIRSDIAVELLQSTHTEILKYICSLLGELASYKPTRVIVSASNLILMQTVSLLRAKDPSVIESALNALGLIAKWTDSAQAVLDAGTIDFSRELVDSSKGQIRKSVCETLGSLARHEPTLRSVLESNLCAQLVSLLHDEDIDVVDSALYALDGTTGFPDGAKAAINAGVLDAIDRLLESSNIHVRDAACSMLENLASYEFAAVGSRKRCALLVSLLRDPDNSVVKSAISALACITTWPDGARATVAAGVLAVFDDLLRDPNSRVQERTCETLGNLARRKFTVDAVLAARPCPSIVSLLRHDDIGVVRSAICALAWIAKSSDGARAAVDVGIMNLVVELGASPDRGVREWVCQALGNMASHEVMAVSILETKPCVTLVNLLTDSDVDIDIIRNAARALAFISRVPQGSQDAMDARAQDVFDALAGSPDREVREWACKFLRNMASHPVTAIVVLKAKPCARLVSLLRDEHTSVMRNAIYALFWIAWTPTGIQVVVDSGMLDFLDELASTGSMMSHESTVDQVVLELDLCARLVGLLRNSDTCVVDGALSVLVRVTRWPRAAEAAMQAGIIDLFDKHWTNHARTGMKCRILGNLARYGSTASAVLESKPCRSLVSFLRDEDRQVVKSALYALSCIAEWPLGAEEALEAGTLGLFDKLITSPDSKVRGAVCKALGNMAFHQSTAPAVIQLRPSLWLGARARKDIDIDVRASALSALSKVSE